MPLDLPHGHAARIHRDDLVVEIGKAALIFGDQLRIERPGPVARNRQRHFRRAGQHRLFRMAIAAIDAALRPLALKVLFELRVQNALRQRFLQIVEQAVLGENLIRIATRQSLVHENSDSPAHGAPVRKRQKIPFNARRSSTRGTPRGLLGRSGSFTEYSKSVRSKRAISTSMIRRLNHAPSDSGIVIMGLWLRARACLLYCATIRTSKAAALNSSLPESQAHRSRRRRSQAHCYPQRDLRDRRSWQQIRA